jgi:SAM-dependent methyltransferase
MKKSVERLARRFVPSTSLLSHNPFFKWIVNFSDLLPRAIWPEFRNLPPNHLRIRVGVGNRFFSNQTFYIGIAENFWLYYINSGAVTLTSSIVDIGCGCGRFAHHLRDYRYADTLFSGKYIGVDIDAEMLDWCRKHFDAPRFEFLQSTHANKSYNKPGESAQTYAIPVEAATVDFVLSRSLFTHLLEPELRNYLEESLRIMKPGAQLAMSFFCLDYPPETYGGRHTFSHKIGNAAVESLAVPEAAVAYTETFMVNLAREVGFSKADVVGRNPANWQQDLVAQK